MSNVSIGDVVGGSIDVYKNDFISHFVANLLFAIVNSFTFSVLYGPMLAGYMRGLRNAESTGSFDIGDIFSCFNDKLGASLVAGILCIVLLSIGFFLCIIPGLLLMPLLPLAVYQIALTEETDGVNAVKTGFRLLQDNFLAAVLTMALLALIGSLGALACGVGVFLTLPIINIGVYLMARQASEGDTQPVTDL